MYVYMETGILIYVHILANFRTASLGKRITEFIHRFPPLGWRCVAAGLDGGWRRGCKFHGARRPCLAPRGLFAKMSRR